MGGSCGFHGGEDKWIQGFGWKSLRKGKLGRSRHQCDNNIEKDPEEI